jgi:hypothetical protein
MTMGLKANADGSGAIQIGGSDAVTITSGLVTSINGGVGGLVSSTAVASTSGTSVDFTSIPSWVRRITVMLNGVSTSGSANLRIQLGDSGGVETTSYDVSGWYINSSGVADSTSASSGFDFFGDAGLAIVRNGVVQIVNLSGNIWLATGSINYSAISYGVVGTKTLSDVLTQVRITTSNGTDTFDAGSINIFYE